MKFKELDLIPKGRNMKTARRIRAFAKSLAKDNNPGETEDRAGWAVDPHQGSGNNPRITR